ncbi:cytosine deaminase [Salmonella enterica subsp. enterica]|uniref:Cytosine deaminase n=1 Tax=Salmonella enterica I TaxID=59201 RepID=A0A379VKH7_SALET|nr:cytosine deaminase [Salmonella enterica subsp. enterica]
MQNNNITIRQARLQGHEGLWQITIENGRFSGLSLRKPHRYRRAKCLMPKAVWLFHRLLSTYPPGYHANGG